MTAQSLSGHGRPLSSQISPKTSVLLPILIAKQCLRAAKCLCPILLMINQLLFKYRKKQSMWLWFGEVKPLMNTFTLPFHQSLDTLEKGIDSKIGIKDRVCQAFLICMTADLPAKEALLNTYI